MSQLEISRDGALGIIVLNRPEAINALSREMIDGIAETLASWRDDAAIGAVLFEGRGPRGFCAGGDVRAVRAQVLAGDLAAADAYFAAEYAMNALIATYPKPIAAIGHGAVMGGGIGILGHAHFSFATAEARFAMPEAAIGFVSDVGVNAILAMVPEPRALAFLLAGQAVGMGDALTLGLCDAVIDGAQIDIVQRGIVAAAGAAEPATALVQLMQTEGVEPGAASLCLVADDLAEIFAAETAEEIVAAAAAHAARGAEAEKLATLLASRSPTSLEAILQSHRQARRRPDIEPVLGLDLRLAAFMVRQPDFIEGVRAVLVDKDQKPAWRPAGYAGLDRQAIAAVVRP